MTKKKKKTCGLNLDYITAFVILASNQSKPTVHL